MHYGDYRNSNNWKDEHEDRLEPLKLTRVKVLIELEVDATVTDYNAHQVVLTHPNMDGSLMFDVENLEEAEDTLDEYQMEVEAAVEKEFESQKEHVKPAIPPTSGVFTLPSSVTEKLTTPPTVTPQVVHVHAKQPIDMETSPVLAIMQDMGEMAELLAKLKPKFMKLKKPKQ